MRSPACLGFISACPEAGHQSSTGNGRHGFSGRDLHASNEAGTTFDGFTSRNPHVITESADVARFDGSKIFRTEIDEKCQYPSWEGILKVVVVAVEY